MSEIFLFLRRVERDMIINIHCSSCKVTFILVSFNPLNAKLNPICLCQALLGAHPILRVSRVRVNETGIFGKNFENIPKIKFHENLYSGSRVGPCGRRTHGHTNMTKLTIALRNFANAPNKATLLCEKLEGY